LAFHLLNVALEIPCLRQTSAVAAPASCSRNIPMIRETARRHGPSLPRRGTLPILGGVCGAQTMGASAGLANPLLD
jgi:hypothetical protein